MTWPSRQLPSSSNWSAAFPTNEGSLTLGPKRKKSASSASLLIDSNIGNGSVNNEIEGQADSRLRCYQCSITFKEVKRLNRHRREVCSLRERLRCDYADCSVTFKAPRHKAAHIRKQHREPVIGELERSGSYCQETELGPMVPADAELDCDLLELFSAPPCGRPSPTPPHDHSYTSTLDERLVSYSLAYTDPDTHHTTAELAIARPDDAYSHTQAVIMAIWAQNIDALSRSVDDSEIDSRFGGAATFELVVKMIGNNTESTSPGHRESRKALADRLMLGVFAQMLPVLTPVKLAFLVGFSDGVVGLVSRQKRSRRDLVQWYLGLGNVWIRQDTLVMHFLWGHNRRCSSVSASGLDSCIEPLSSRWERLA